MPGLQRLSYAGKNFEDSARSLEQCVPSCASCDTMPMCSMRVAWRSRGGAARRYGVAYWHKKFPHWPLVIRRH